MRKPLEPRGVSCRVGCCQGEPYEDACADGNVENGGVTVSGDINPTGLDDLVADAARRTAHCKDNDEMTPRRRHKRRVHRDPMRRQSTEHPTDTNGPSDKLLQAQSGLNARISGRVQRLNLRDPGIKSIA